MRVDQPAKAWAWRWLSVTGPLRRLAHRCSTSVSADEQEMDEKTETKAMGQVIQIGEAQIRDHTDQGSRGNIVRGTLEEALNARLEAKADRLCGASPRSA